MKKNKKKKEKAKNKFFIHPPPSDYAKVLEQQTNISNFTAKTQNPQL